MRRDTVLFILFMLFHVNFTNGERVFNLQYIFPIRNLSTNPQGLKIRRHYIDPSVVNKTIRTAVKKVGINKNYTNYRRRLNDENNRCVSKPKKK